MLTTLASHKGDGEIRVSQVRGADAPTSGNQDHVGVDELALNKVLDELRSRANAWASVSASERAGLLARIVTDTYAVAEEWNNAACAAKGYDPAGPIPRSREPQAW